MSDPNPNIDNSGNSGGGGTYVGTFFKIIGVILFLYVISIIYNFIKNAIAASTTSSTTNNSNNTNGTTTTMTNPIIGTTSPTMVIRPNIILANPGPVTGTTNTITNPGTINTITNPGTGTVIGPNPASTTTGEYVTQNQLKSFMLQTNQQLSNMTSIIRTAYPGYLQNEINELKNQLTTFQPSYEPIFPSLNTKINTIENNISSIQNTINNLPSSENIQNTVNMLQTTFKNFQNNAVMANLTTGTLNVVSSSYSIVFSSFNGKTNTQSIPNGGPLFTILTTYWNHYINYFMKNDTPSGSIIITTPGTYLITYDVSFSPNPNGRRGACVYKNYNTDKTYYGYSQIPAVADGDRTGVTGSIVLPCNTGDQLNIGVYQTSGGNLDMDTSVGGIWTVTLLQSTNTIKIQ